MEEQTHQTHQTSNRQEETNTYVENAQPQHTDQAHEHEDCGVGEFEFTHVITTSTDRTTTPFRMDTLFGEGTSDQQTPPVHFDSFFGEGTSDHRDDNIKLVQDYERITTPEFHAFGSTLSENVENNNHSFVLPEFHEVDTVEMREVSRMDAPFNTIILPITSHTFGEIDTDDSETHEQHTKKTEREENEGIPVVTTIRGNGSKKEETDIVEKLEKRVQITRIPNVTSSSLPTRVSNGQRATKGPRSTDYNPQVSIATQGQKAVKTPQRTSSVDVERNEKSEKTVPNNTTRRTGPPTSQPSELPKTPKTTQPVKDGSGAREKQTSNDTTPKTGSSTVNKSSSTHVVNNKRKDGDNTPNDSSKTPSKKKIEPITEDASDEEEKKVEEKKVTMKHTPVKKTKAPSVSSVEDKIDIGGFCVSVPIYNLCISHYTARKQLGSSRGDDTYEWKPSEVTGVLFGFGMDKKESSTSDEKTKRSKKQSKREDRENDSDEKNRKKKKKKTSSVGESDSLYLTDTTAPWTDQENAALFYVLNHARTTGTAMSSAGLADAVNKRCDHMRYVHRLHTKTTVRGRLGRLKTVGAIEKQGDFYVVLVDKNNIQIEEEQEKTKQVQSPDSRNVVSSETEDDDNEK